MKESKYSNRNNHGIFHVRCMFHFIENMFNSNAIYREFQLLKDQLKATKGICPLFILCRGGFDKRIYRNSETKMKCYNEEHVQNDDQKKCSCILKIRCQE